MIQEELVKYTTAKLAEEKGFNEICIHFYIPEINKVNTFEDEKLHTNSNFKTKLIKNICAPTQAHLQRWLRDVHKIHVHVYSVHRNTGEIMWSVDVYDLRYPNDERYNVMIGYKLSDGIKNTYEEALEMGLDAALRVNMLWKNN